MTLRESLSKIRDKLQDTDGIYWHDSELIDLHNECKRYMSAERKDKPTTIDLSISSAENEYEIEGALRYISVKDSNGKDRPIYPNDGSGDNDEYGIVVQHYDSIYVNEPVDGVVLYIRCISFPEDDNLNDDIRMGDENSYKYYILSKCYEKDNDMEQFQKAQYYWNMFMESFKSVKKTDSSGFINQTNMTRSYFY